MTDVDVALGGEHWSGRVDANCGVDEKATLTNTRAYYHMIYPWFGQRVAADKPQWRLSVDVRRTATPAAKPQFVFSFSDGARSGTIQQVRGGERMGSGTVRVTRRGAGVRFQVDGRTKEGDAVHATIECSQLSGSEAVGG